MPPTESSQPPPSPAETEQFVRLFGRVQHSLRAYVLSLVPYWDEAEEIFQNTNLILWRKFREFDPDTNFRTWACKVAWYEVLEWRRQRHKAQSCLSETVLAQLAAELVDDAELAESRERALAQCLDTLSPADRELVQLRYFIAQEVPAVASQVGRSVNAVYKAINRIRWRLFECIERRLRQEDRS